MSPLVRFSCRICKLSNLCCIDCKLFCLSLLLEYCKWWCEALWETEFGCYIDKGLKILLGFSVGENALLSATELLVTESFVPILFGDKITFFLIFARSIKLYMLFFWLILGFVALDALLGVRLLEWFYGVLCYWENFWSGDRGANGS